MKLKSFSVIYFIYIIAISGQLSNELIWSSRTFYPKNINGINPSSDGDFYTSIERKNGQTEIVKYSYKKNKKIATLFSNFLFENFNFSDYDISNDEIGYYYIIQKNSSTDGLQNHIITCII